MEGDDCFICRGNNGTDDRANLVVYRSELSIVFLNQFPYNNGHLMVVPYRHTGDVQDLTDEDFLDLTRMLRKWMDILQRAMKPEGFNVGMNVGTAGGAGIADHVHLHVVPRWNGDTNFMPVVGGTKVLSQGLEEAYDVLVRASIV